MIPEVPFMKGLFYFQPSMKQFAYARGEKLKRRKLISGLFAHGRPVSVPGLRLVFQPSPGNDSVMQMGVGASSRHFKKATDRNRIKRLLRETYRLNKPALISHLSATGQPMVAFIIYTDKGLPEFQALNSKMQVLLNKLIQATSGSTPADH